MKKTVTLLFVFLSVSIHAQQSVFATISGGDLYSIDVVNCTRTFVGSTGHGFGDLAFTPDGNLWGIVSGNLYHIDTVNANATFIGFTGIQAVTLVGLNDSTLLSESQSVLYKINTSTAASTFIDSIGYSAAGDLTWYDNDLYMVTPLVKIELDSSYSSIISVTPINLTIPSCEGAVTAPFPGDYNSIVGFNGPDALKICQIDGSYSVLCPNLNFQGTPGAASIRLQTQIPQPTSCSITPVSEIPEVVDFLIMKNPVLNQLEIKRKSSYEGVFIVNNSIGSQLKSIVVNEKELSIPVNELPTGIYSLTLVTRREVNSIKFIIVK